MELGLPEVDKPHSLRDSDPIAEAIANGARGAGLVRPLSPLPLINARPGSREPGSRRNVGAVGYLDETDFCLMIADVVAQPF